jgi:hypothetical protein
MGPEPLVIQIVDWKLQIDISDADTRVCIITNDKPHSYRYVRLTPKQAEQLRDYLHDNLPVTA